tara:strand:+ start:201 stop:347 length:147 start_codon:yes stop_codon:yes gene_type:complete
LLDFHDASDPLSDAIVSRVAARAADEARNQNRLLHQNGLAPVIARPFV